MVIDIVLIILSSVSSRSLAHRWHLNVLEIVLYQSKWSTTAEQDHHSKIKMNAESTLVLKQEVTQSSLLPG